jgi:hypothetical protein
MFKYLDNLDKTKPSLNKLAMLPGFNILESPISNLKEPLTYSNEAGYKNSISLDKATINDQIFFKLYGLIDTAKKQLSKKSRKKTQQKSTRKNKY